MRTRSWVLGACWIVASLVAGCSAAAPLGEGGACVRNAQCAAGLVCGMGRCTADLTGYGMGMVPSMDAGLPDAATDDAAVDLDSGPPVDSGTPIDSGPPGMDAGPPEVDAGPPPVDSGPPETDAGPPPVDSGPAETDAGTEDDAGMM